MGFFIFVGFGLKSVLEIMSIDVLFIKVFFLIVMYSNMFLVSF